MTPPGKPLILAFQDAHDLTEVGGKGVNLAKLIRADFPVPDGFIISTSAFRHARAAGEGIPEDLTEMIIAAYRTLGSPRVAVRSSATAEDREDASMAGQYETFLNIQGESALLDAVSRCWASLDSTRTRSYLARHGLTPEEVAMGVVVQKQCASDVAGVLFTANPGSRNPRSEMIVEASWGLGESVVGGEVQPDTLTLDAETGAVKTVSVGTKATLLAPGASAIQETPIAQRETLCIKATQLLDLWRLGKKIEAYFGAPQDLEWGFEGDTLYLLQSRAITTLDIVEERTKQIHTTQTRLRKLLDQEQGPWVLHNLAETLPTPTPLTWSVIHRFMSAEGGFGRLYRRAGFEPSTRLSETGFLEKICGRIYMDLSLAPEMFFESFPLAYDLKLLRTNPGAAQEPPTLPKGSIRDRQRIGKRLALVEKNLNTLAETYDQQFLTHIVPEFQRWVAEEKQRDLSLLSTNDWLECWKTRETKVMSEFAPESLLPSLIVTQALQNLEGFLAVHVWDEDPKALARLLSLGSEADSSVRSVEALRESADNGEAFRSWLHEYGHRAPGEFDLSEPRWREQPGLARDMARRLAAGPSPLTRHRQQAQHAADRLAALKADLPADAARELEHRVHLVHRYQCFREDGKHELMRGFDLLRDLLIEATRRLQPAENLALLTFEEMKQALLMGLAPLNLLHLRERKRKAESDIILPPLLTSEDLDTLGDPPEMEMFVGQRSGLAVSPGRHTGPVHIVMRPEEAGDMEAGYVLVCPSTDPNWTPLFVNAGGLILECGGALSHGAVVAREMGLPAVVIPGATRLLADGESVTVDGHRGWIAPGRKDSESPEDIPDEIPRTLIPPPPGAREFAGNRLRNRGLAFWGTFLIALFLLPDPWIFHPSLRIIDRLLLPLAATIGRPWTVALVSGFFACVCMAGQRFLTDTPRLREASLRAKALTARNKTLALDAPSKRLAAKMISGVNRRVLFSSFIPLAVLLGPMLLVFLWFGERLGPGMANPAPGVVAHVTASVDGDYTDRVELVYDPALNLDPQTPPVQHNPPIRTRLQQLRREWQQERDLTHLKNWAERAAALETRETLLNDLDHFLSENIPPHEMRWTLYTPLTEGGRYPLTLRAADGNELNSYVVTGSLASPEPRELVDPARPLMQVVRGNNAPLLEMRVAYAQNRVRDADVFARPFAFLGVRWQTGWLGIYLIAYLPLMFFFRRLFNVP